MTIKDKILQIISGIFFILASILLIWLENDATVAILFVPLGLYLMFTKEQVMFW